MDIRQMHIDFHRMRQSNLGNDYKHLTSESVDDTLNMTINDFIRLKTNNEQVQEGQANVIVEQYYEGLENLIRTSEVSLLPTYPYNPMGKVVNLHGLSIADDDKYKSSGKLLAGSKCRILSYQGSDDFTNVGGSNEIGATFSVQGIATFQPSDKSSGYVMIDANGNYITGNVLFDAGLAYTILNGTITFTENSIQDYGVNVDGKTYIGGVNQHGPLVIEKGSIFIMNGMLQPTNWNSHSIIETVNAGDEYYKLIGSVSVVNYSNQGKPIEVLSPNRLYKSRDVNQYLAHSRGTVISSPISHMEGGELIVYQNKDSDTVPINERFSISKVLIKYYKKPNIVSLAHGIDCDLNEIDHPEIVRKAVEASCASDATRNYQYIEANNEKMLQFNLQLINL